MALLGIVENRHVMARLEQILAHWEGGITDNLGNQMHLCAHLDLHLVAPRCFLARLRETRCILTRAQTKDSALPKIHVSDQSNMSNQLLLRKTAPGIV